MKERLRIGFKRIFRVRVVFCCALVWSTLTATLFFLFSTSSDLYSNELKTSNRQLNWQPTTTHTDSPYSPSPTSCRNTVQGSVYLADSRGYVCKREQVNSTTGCCTVTRKGTIGGDEERDGTTAPYYCEECDSETKCCSHFEFCVSCCLATPLQYLQRTATDKRTLRAPQYEFGDPFNLCKLLCRTSSNSVVHENTYRSNLKYCYGASLPPLKAPD